MEGLIGRKIGMTSVFVEDGGQVPVTVIEAGPCVVVQRKTVGNDGYSAVQLGFGSKKEKNTSKAQLTRFKAVGSAPRRWAREFLVDEKDEIKAGDTITAAIFEDATFVDVTAMTKGRGFQGAVKRHGMHGGRMSHGRSDNKRRTGAIGCASYPARVYKGKKMPGHMGNVQVTQQNLKVVAVKGDDNVLLVRGAVPGPAGHMVIVKKALKKGRKQ